MVGNVGVILYRLISVEWSKAERASHGTLRTWPPALGTVPPSQTVCSRQMRSSIRLTQTCRMQRSCSTTQPLPVVGLQFGGSYRGWGLREAKAKLSHRNTDAEKKTCLPIHGAGVSSPKAVMRWMCCSLSDTRL